MSELWSRRALISLMRPAHGPGFSGSSVSESYEMSRVTAYLIHWSVILLIYGAVLGIGITGWLVPNARNVTIGSTGDGLLVMPRSAPQTL
jgi:hypothetical protein